MSHDCHDSFGITLSMPLVQLYALQTLPPKPRAEIHENRRRRAREWHCPQEHREQGQERGQERPQLNNEPS